LKLLLVSPVQFLKFPPDAQFFGLIEQVLPVLFLLDPQVALLHLLQ
jgi:hypothetical protein